MNKCKHKGLTFCRDKIRGYIEGVDICNCDLTDECICGDFQNVPYLVHVCYCQDCGCELRSQKVKEFPIKELYYA